MGFGDWMAKALRRAPEPTEEEVAAAKAKAEELNKKINPAGQKAVETDRKRKKLIDRQLDDDPSVYTRKPGSDD